VPGCGRRIGEVSVDVDWFGELGGERKYVRDLRVADGGDQRL
jgi:hypothetical protein